MYGGGSSSSGSHRPWRVQNNMGSAREGLIVAESPEVCERLSKYLDWGQGAFTLHTVPQKATAGALPGLGRFFCVEVQCLKLT